MKKENGSLHSLEWLVDEIEASLKQAFEALDAYLKDPADEPQIRFCQSSIHQVHGTLKIAECHGAILLAAEMEELVEALLQNKIANISEASDVLVQAILKLPAYIRQIVSSGSDQPAILISLVNDLRAVCGKPLLSEGSLFSPHIELDSAGTSVRSSLLPDNDAFVELLKKLRQMYQVALLGLIRNAERDKNLAYIDRVFNRLYELSKGTAQHQLWRVALAVQEGISHHSIPLSSAMTSLLRALDREIRQLQKHGVASLQREIPASLLKNLLYYVAYSNGNTIRILEVSEAFRLREALPVSTFSGSGGLTPTFDPDAIRAIATALLEEVNNAKELTTRYQLEGALDDTLVVQLEKTIVRMADTLAFIGQSRLSEPLSAIQHSLQNVIDQSAKLDEQMLHDLANQLVDTESSLVAWGSSGGAVQVDGDQANMELQRARESLLRETRNGLEKVKDSIVEYISSQWDKHFLEHTPQLLTEVRGALDMMLLDRPAAVLETARRYIQEQLLTGAAIPDWNTLDNLADAITSIEYYLDGRVDGEESSESLAILSMAENSAEALFNEAAPQPVAETADSNEYELVDDSEHLTVEQPVVDETPQPDTDAVEDADDSEVDEEIVEVFVEEADEVLGMLGELLPQWQANPVIDDTLTDIRRGFHTLKGSGRMVEALRIGELAWSVEYMLNRMIDNLIPVTPAVPALIGEVVDILPGMVAGFRDKQPEQNSDQIDQLMEKASILARGEEIELAEQSKELPAEPSQELPAELSVVELPEQSLEEQPTELSAEPSAPSVDLPDPVDIDDQPAEQPVEEEDDNLMAIFAGETRQHLEAVSEFIGDTWQLAPQYSAPTPLLLRAMHTLKGSANMADVQPVAELMGPLESLVKDMYNFQQPVDEQLMHLLNDCVTGLYAILPILESGDENAGLDGLPELVQRIEDARSRLVAPLLAEEQPADSESSVDRRQLMALMAEGMHGLLSAQQILNHWRDSGEQPEFEPLISECDELSRAAAKAGEEPLAALAAKLGDAFQVAGLSVAGHDQFVAIAFADTHDSLLAMVDAVAADQASPAVDVQLATLDKLINELHQQPADDATDTVEEVAEPAEEETLDQSPEPTEAVEPEVEEAAVPEEVSPAPVEADEAAIESVEPEPEPEPEPEAKAEAELEPEAQAHEAEPADEPVAEPAATADDDFDREVLEIFLEETNELLETIDNTIHAWREDVGNSEWPEEIKRALHTFKGGARMAGQDELGDLSHDFESWLVESEQQASSDDGFFEQLQTRQDQLHAQVRALRSEFSVPEGSDSAVPATVETADQSQFSGLSADLHKVVVPQLTAETSAPQEMVKVPAGLLDKLVNMAGETSISRGRVEQQISEFSFALDEMNTTIRRLQDQVRRLGIETEAQVMFRREQIEASNASEDFDPLEMDRYSKLQQLSRSLMESASDLQDLKGTLAQKSKEAETLLVQQSRINTDLQEGLMRSRMVPFSRLVPRLRRIVRQVGGELDKQVELKLINVEGEMDRSVLERMLPAFDHMLRNAIDHGIESSEDRLAAGKPEQGVISIDLAREGGDILIKLADDGQGLDIEAIRKQAIQQGMMAHESELSDHEVLQFILESGFSTSETVSHISGRGVGLDVVNADVRQLGGAIAIRTEAGIGTEFQIRLPFTVSINRALMIEIGDDSYALPLTSIDGVVRLSPKQLEHFYSNPHQRYEYGGSQYSVRHLGSLLHDGTPPRISADEQAIPLVLVRSEQQSFAVQVDRLVGSSEIVVKTLGAQFSTVPGLSGATVLGDGRVVVILDLLALLRTQKVLASTKVQWLEDATAADAEASVPSVMVVDDSVTVRKVTSRFLEREGFNVLTAKDGADAMRLLRDHDPDVMLLDIEMPRMDGFEVASRLRSMGRFEQLPIIMITSRTGDKHRERALSLGVNHYLGKPYREEDLRQAIDELLTEPVA